MSRALQQELHARLTLAAEVLDLPLTGQHLEALAVELTPAIAALLASQQATADETTPVPYTLTDTPDDAKTEVSLEGTCIARIGLDVDLDSPAAVLAQRLRSSQYDVVATEVPDEATLMLTVRPQSLDCWRWWMAKCSAYRERPKGKLAEATGSWGGVTVHLRGEGVLDMQQQGSARLLSAVLGGLTLGGER
ncbi:hypothetical protein [Streptomyces sp. LNU-CPARS28]|uniref:hypothetical protein n=1 Tax=Streptomyces sp. LNU-CPARS28 TaxID=3137371 RepID=UPI0031359C23